jgi:hypothetical protein
VSGERGSMASVSGFTGTISCWAMFSGSGSGSGSDARGSLARQDGAAHEVRYSHPPDSPGTPS